MSRVNGNVLGIYNKAAKHFSSGNALSLMKLPVNSHFELCSALKKGGTLSIKLNLFYKRNVFGGGTFVRTISV